jgi:Tfp pilus assembly protein PilF
MGTLKNVMLKLAVPAVLIGIIAACGGVKQVNTGINIPDLDKTQFNDTAYTEGWELLKLGKPDDALKWFQASNVVDDKLHVAFGYVFLAQNKLAFAKQNFEKALQLNPENLQAYFGLAAMHELLKENDKAFRIYSRLLNKHPENSWLKARYEFLKSSETQHYLEQARQLKGTNQTEKYIEALKNAASYSPELTDIEIEMAEYYLGRQAYDEAAFHYENVIQQFPNRTDILDRLAEVYEKGQKFDSAVVIYRKLLELKPGEITYLNKVNELKIKFYEINMPEKFKNIFFKQDINREEIAALIGHYFDKYLESRTPVIITDISGSFAMKEIIRVGTLGIMKIRPDHSFDRLGVIDRASFAVITGRLLSYLGDQGYSVDFPPPAETVEAVDISPQHREYLTISLMLNAGLIKLDAEGRFNPTLKVSPAEVLLSIRKIINHISEPGT